MKQLKNNFDCITIDEAKSKLKKIKKEIKKEQLIN